MSTLKKSTRLLIAAVVAVGAASTAAVVTPVLAGPAEPPPRAAAAPPARAAASLDPAMLQAALREVVEAGAPAAYAEVRDGRERWSATLGARDLKTGERAEPGDRFRAASTTKSMVATVVLQLVEEGRLGLDDRFADHLPGLLPDDRITIRHLLGHRSGLADHLDVLMPSLAEGSTAELEAVRGQRFSARELVELAAAQPLVAEPGTTFSYSTSGYLALGLLVEDLTGKPIADELQLRVFAPAEMRATSYPVAEATIDGPHPHGYLAGDRSGDPLRDVTRFPPDIFGAGGAVISTTGDLNRLYRALFDGTLLPPDLLAQMRTPTFDAGYGLGLFATPMPGCGLPGDVLWGHTGNAFGYRTVSMSSLDGQRQLTLAFTLDGLHAGGPPELNRAALQRFVITAACGVALPPAE